MGGVAAWYFDTPLERATLERESDALAVALASELGVVAGDRVAVQLQNVPQWPIALSAAWKLGAAVVPVNPMLTPRERAVLLEDSGAQVLIALEALAGGAAVPHVVTTSPLEYLDEVPALLAGIERVPGTWTELIARHDGERPPARQPADDEIALLTYTSGTTGPPKGAMNTHGNVRFNARTYRDWIGLTGDDVVLAIAPLFHITGLVGHMAVAELVGMPLILAHRFDAAETLRLAERHGATFTVAAITAYIALLREERGALPALRAAYSGGAPIAPAVVEAFERRFGVYIHNIYGLTETTSPSHAVPFGTRAPVDPGTGALSVGKPVSETSSRIVDEAGEEVPAGELGEIATAGPQVVPGYWRGVEEVGVPFRTGDVGFVDDDGWFFVVDRKKDQINASGYKVWPREVEDALHEHPAVSEVAVVGVADDYRGETVKAFVVAQAPVTPDELIAFARERLAAYKRPRLIELVEELPKTATGKVLRRELRSRST
jgi:long-chain acyl-CoA synthetase